MAPALSPSSRNRTPLCSGGFWAGEGKAIVPQDTSKPSAPGASPALQLFQLLLLLQGMLLLLLQVFLQPFCVAFTCALHPPRLCP